MTVSELREQLQLTAYALPDGTREVTGGYTGDLLSWAMGRAKEGDAWFTVMGNVIGAEQTPSMSMDERLHHLVLKGSLQTYSWIYF